MLFWGLVYVYIRSGIFHLSPLLQILLLRVNIYYLHNAFFFPYFSRGGKSACMKSTHPCRTLDENESTFTLAYKNPFGKRRQWRKTRNYRIKFTQLNNLLCSVPLSSRKAWNSPPPPNHRLSYVALKKAHSKNSYIVPTVQDSIRELPTRTPLRPWKVKVRGKWNLIFSFNFDIHIFASLGRSIKYYRKRFSSPLNWLQLNTQNPLKWRGDVCRIKLTKFAFRHLSKLPFGKRINE